MKRLALVAIFSFWVLPAFAQTGVLDNYRDSNNAVEVSNGNPMPGRSGSYGKFTAPQYCQITSLSAATALTTANCATGTILATATISEICVETSAVRYTSSGVVTPTASVGMPVAAGTCFQYAGPISTIEFIQQTSGAILDVETFP